MPKSPASIVRDGIQDRRIAALDLATLRAVRQAEDRVVEAAVAYAQAWGLFKEQQDQMGRGEHGWDATVQALNDHFAVLCFNALMAAVDALRAARTGGRDA